MTTFVGESAPVLPLPAIRQVEVGRHPVWILLVAFDAVALAVPALIWAPNWWGASLVALVVAALALRGHYQVPIAPAIADRVGDFVGCVALPLGLVIGVAHGSVLDRVSGPVIPLVWAAATGIPLLFLARASCYARIRAWRARGWLIEPIVIIGAGRMGVELSEVLEDHPEYGLHPIGFLDSFDDVGLGLPLLGRAEDLEQVLQIHRGVRRVVIAFGATREPDMVTILRACDQADVDIYVLPRFFELAYGAKERDVEVIWGLPLRRLRRAAARTRGRRLKRAFDIIASGSVILFLSPLLVAVAAAVRFSSPGPIFFRQRRVGQLDAPIDVLKFRTMRVNDQSDVQWNVASDDDVTSVGRMLRRTSVDELPQLFNVLRGDMSLVGPRPERPHFVDRFVSEVPRYADRHRVPVGITGLAQVHGLRGDTSIDQRARMDNQYIENWSLWQDVVILSRTAVAVIRTARRPQ